jgi:hypothetical protein
MEEVYKWGRKWILSIPEESDWKLVGECGKKGSYYSFRIKNPYSKVQIKYESKIKWESLDFTVFPYKSVYLTYSIDYLNGEYWIRATLNYDLESTKNLLYPVKIFIQEWHNPY